MAAICRRLIHAGGGMEYVKKQKKFSLFAQTSIVFPGLTSLILGSRGSAEASNNWTALLWVGCLLWVLARKACRSRIFLYNSRNPVPIHSRPLHRSSASRRTGKSVPFSNGFWPYLSPIIIEVHPRLSWGQAITAKGTTRRIPAKHPQTWRISSSSLERRPSETSLAMETVRDAERITADGWKAHPHCHFPLYPVRDGKLSKCNTAVLTDGRKGSALHRLLVGGFPDPAQPVIVLLFAHIVVFQPLSCSSRQGASDIEGQLPSIAPKRTSWVVWSIVDTSSKNY